MNRVTAPETDEPSIANPTTYTVANAARDYLDWFRTARKSYEHFGKGGEDMLTKYICVRYQQRDIQASGPIMALLNLPLRREAVGFKRYSRASPLITY